MAEKKPRGRNTLKFDYKEVEQLASEGWDKTRIAEGLGASKRTFTRRMADTPEFADAFNRGRFKYRKDVMKRWKKHAANQPIPLIFEQKQEAAFGWTDRQENKQTAEITFNVRVGIQGPEEPKRIEQDAIEIEGGPVPEDV